MDGYTDALSKEIKQRENLGLFVSWVAVIAPGQSEKITKSL